MLLVKLPWVRDPVQPLIDKHQGKPNIHQALRVYKTQCINVPEVKEKVRIAHSEVAEHKVMNKLSNLPDNSADLLTKKHNLTVEDTSTGVNWWSGLLWMRLGTNFSLSITNYH